MPVCDRDFALVVGINDYPDYRPLQGAIEDARDFHRWLVDTNDGGGIPQAQCKLVVSTPNPVHPIQDDIDDALSELLDAVEQTPGRRFYLYFSGHGLSRSNMGADLCLARWSRRKRNAALDSEEYLKLVADPGRFAEVVFLLDCCRVRLVEARGLRSTIHYGAGNSGNVRLFTAYAAEFQNSAFEATVAGAGGDEPIVRGHFSRALMAGLRGGAARRDGGVPANDLKTYLEKETPRIAAESKHNQTPVVVNGLSGGADEPVFGAALPQSNVVITFTPQRAGHTVTLEGPSLDIVRKGPADAAGWSLTLDGGLHLLRDEANGNQLEIRFRPEEGVKRVDF